MVKIMLKGKAKILVPNKRGKTGLIYIPADIVKDSSFPFKPNEEVTVKIEGEKLVIEKRRKEEKD
jgi:antitoxin component of MazEF toxin-antitoxin module